MGRMGRIGWLTVVLVLVAVGAGLAQVDVEFTSNFDSGRLRLTMNNTTDQPQQYRVWAGQVHRCVLPGYQPMVVGEDAVWTIAPRGQREAFVVTYCGNSRLSAPSERTLYHPAEGVNMRLRQVILQAPPGGDVQSLIWRETDRLRLPESGTLGARGAEIPATGVIAGTTAVPLLMARANMLRGDSEMLQADGRPDEEARSAHTRSMAMVAGLLLIPLPLAVIMLVTCRSAARGPRRGSR